MRKNAPPSVLPVSTVSARAPAAPSASAIPSASAKSRCMFPSLAAEGRLRKQAVARREVEAVLVPLHARARRERLCALPRVARALEQERLLVERLQVEPRLRVLRLELYRALEMRVRALVVGHQREQAA